MIKYRTDRYQPTQIEPVEIDKETAASVWSSGRRWSKMSEYHQFHDTWKEAHTHLIYTAESKIRHAHAELERQKSYLGNLKGMQNP